MVFPLEASHPTPADPAAAVIYFRTVLCPEETSHFCPDFLMRLPRKSNSVVFPFVSEFPSRRHFCSSGSCPLNYPAWDTIPEAMQRPGYLSGLLKFTSRSIMAKQPEKVQHFNYFGSLITNDAKCTRDSKSRISIARAAFVKKETL